MKRVTLALAVGLVLIACAPAQDIEHLHVGLTGTVTWSEPSEWLDEQLIPGVDTVSYQVYGFEYGTVVDDQNTALLVLLGEVPIELFVVDLSAQSGRYWAIGVRPVIHRNYNTSVGDIGWSYDGAVADTDQGRWLIDRDGGVLEIGTVRGLRIGD